LPVEQPEVRFSIAGVPVPGAVSLELESVGYFAADRFRIGMALGAAPFTTAGYFSTLGVQTVTVEVAPSGLGYALLLTGQIDNIRIDYLRNLATLSGRDLSARLIDSESAETFVNHTSSQIAAILAARHGLNANVTPTSTPVGQYYEIDHARSGLGLNSRATTDWNLLTELALIENFDLSVTGMTLNFGPPVAAMQSFWTVQNFTALGLDVAVTLPKAATVKSWNSRQKVVVSETVGRGGTTTVIRPNLTTAQAQMVAQNHLKSLDRHGMILIGVMPGDVTTEPGTTFVLSGTNSAFDTTYSVSAVTRVLSPKEGFFQTVHAYVSS
jgi:hypothetical protein